MFGQNSPRTAMIMPENHVRRNFELGGAELGSLQHRTWQNLYKETTGPQAETAFLSKDMTLMPNAHSGTIHIFFFAYRDLYYYLDDAAAKAAWDADLTEAETYRDYLEEYTYVVTFIYYNGDGAADIDRVKPASRSTPDWMFIEAPLWRDDGLDWSNDSMWNDKDRLETYFEKEFEKSCASTAGIYPPAKAVLVDASNDWFMKSGYDYLTANWNGSAYKSAWLYHVSSPTGLRWLRMLGAILEMEANVRYNADYRDITEF